MSPNCERVLCGKTRTGMDPYLKHIYEDESPLFRVITQNYHSVTGQLKLSTLLARTRARFTFSAFSASLCQMRLKSAEGNDVLCFLSWLVHYRWRVVQVITFLCLSHLHIVSYQQPTATSISVLLDCCTFVQLGVKSLH